MDVPGWVDELAEAHRSEHVDGCIGTVRYIDPAARLRGIRAATEGGCLSLARPIIPGVRHNGRNTMEMDLFTSSRDYISHGSDRVHLEAHGLGNTHLDGLTHVGVSGTWHGGQPCDHQPEMDETLPRWAAHGIATRALLLDIPACRGVDYVTPEQPVTNDDLDIALDRCGIEPEPGDALLLYMGRDRFEADGGEYLPISQTDRRGGVHQSGAQWIAKHRFSVLCWDFLDAHGPGIDLLSTHMLVWSIGMALVDNCALGQAARMFRDRPLHAGLVVIAPLSIQGTTGCTVNPLLLY